MNIHISIDAGSADEARHEMAKLLGSPQAYTFTLETKAAQPIHDEGGSVVAEAAPVAEATAPAAAEPPKKRGRRTKAEIEADNAKAVQAAPEPAQISTGEERVAPDDTPEDEVQDMDDEVAESAAGATETYTYDSVRDAVGRYIAKYGIPAAQEDGMKVFRLVAGDHVNKTTDLPDDSAVLGRIVEGIDEAIAKNPFKRTAVS